MKLHYDCELDGKDHSFTDYLISVQFRWKNYDEKRHILKGIID